MIATAAGCDSGARGSVLSSREGTRSYLNLQGVGLGSEQKKGYREGTKRGSSEGTKKNSSLILFC